MTSLSSKVESLLRRRQFAQRSPEWYSIRETMLTASDVAAALDIKPYASYRGSPRAELLQKKLSGSSFTGNRFTEHGNKYEDEARSKYEVFNSEKVLEFGLLQHPTIPWLGASPDGITLSGKVVEIKCPMSRDIIPNEIPHHYYPQVQIVMEVCDLDEAVFIQYKPFSITWPYPEQFFVTNVARDKQWFKSVLPALESFWNQMNSHTTKCEILSNCMTSFNERSSSTNQSTSSKSKSKHIKCLVQHDICSKYDTMEWNI